MGVLAAFLLIVALVVIAGFGVGVYVIAMRLRARQLSRGGDLVEGGEQPGDAAPRRRRPEHVRVSGEQRSRFVREH